ncbi:hypothetical protein TrispH2_011701, partial [Trichoplax sp. H2]
KYCRSVESQILLCRTSLVTIFSYVRQKAKSLSIFLSLGNQDELQTQIQTQDTRQDNNQQSYHQSQQVQQKHQIPITSNRQGGFLLTCFNMIATELPISKLFQLGILLQLTNHEIKEIKSSTEIDSNYEKIYQVLELWKQKKGQDADHKEVISALRKVGVKGIADKIELELKE